MCIAWLSCYAGRYCIRWYGSTQGKKDMQFDNDCGSILKLIASTLAAPCHRIICIVSPTEVGR